MATEQPVSTQDAEERRRNEQWAQGRRKEMQIAAGAAALVLAGAVYFGGLNVYLLYREKPAPFQIAVSQPRGAALPADYRVTVEWAGGDGSIVRPSISINEITVPTASARPSFSDPHLHSGENAKLNFVIPSNCTPGLHNGRMILQKVSGSSDAQNTLDAPVRVQVVGGFWTSWFLLRDWLIISFAVLGLIYAFFLVLSPVPSGDLSLEHYNGVTHSPAVTIRLRPRRSAVFMPWRRSALPLSRVFKEACIPGCGLAGQILFKMPRYPVLVLEQSAVDRVFGMGRVNFYDPSRPLRGCGPVEVMWGEDSFIAFAETRGRPPYLVVRYKAC